MKFSLDWLGDWLGLPPLSEAEFEADRRALLDNPNCKNHEPTDYGDFTLRERMQNINEMLSGKRDRMEIRAVAIGWNPDLNTDCHDYKEGETMADGTPTFYRVIRKAK